VTSPPPTASPPTISPPGTAPRGRRSAAGISGGCCTATTVDALTAYNGTLYVGGHFNQAGSTSVSNVAALNLASGSWSSLGGGASLAGNNASVNALVFNPKNHTLYATGWFTRASDQDATSFASWNGAAWSGYGAGLQDAGGTGNGESLALDPVTGAVYVGGVFTSAGSASSTDIAKLSSGTFKAVGNATSAGNPIDVYGLAFAGGKLYAGGKFDAVNGVPASRLAVFDGTSWSEPGGGVDSLVNALIPSGTGVIAGGYFQNAGTSHPPAQPMLSVGRLTAAGWSSYGQGMVLPGEDQYPSVWAIVPYGGGAYVGGNFAGAGPAASSTIARWTGTAWTSLAGGVRWGGGLGTVYAMLTIGNQLYVGGHFDSAGGVPANNIARWDGTSWHALGSGVQGGNVLALATLNGKLYAGGTFLTAGAPAPMTSPCGTSRARRGVPWAETRCTPRPTRSMRSSPSVTICFLAAPSPGSYPTRLAPTSSTTSPCSIRRRRSPLGPRATSFLAGALPGPSTP
jgi:hypothetical protein